MRSENYINVQQHKTDLINEKWNKTQTVAPFVTFYDMRAVTFVLPDEMTDVSIAGLQWFILIPQINHMGSHTACCNPINYGESSRSSLILVASYNMT